MKKKLTSIILAVVMAATLLTACGKGKGAETAAPAEDKKTEAAAPAEDKKAEAAAPAEDKAEEAAPAAEEAGEMVSDETFSILQDNYALLTEVYNAVADAYNSDEVAADADIEEAMNEAADVIEQMGEITQDTLTEEDAEELNGAMKDILDALSYVVDGMEVVDGAEGEMVSDETFTSLQENYEIMAQAYNAVAEAYNSDEVAADADIEAALQQAYDIIEKMGTITQDSITEADAEELVNAMIAIIEVLDTVVDAMG